MSEAVNPVTPETPVTPAAPPVAPMISLDGLDADLKANKTIAGLHGKPIGEALRMLANAESLVGKKGVVLPTGPEDKAGLAAYRRAIGVPESPEKYPAPQLPAGFEADEAMDKQLRAWGVEMGWTPEQYRGLVERIAQWNVSESQNASAAKAAQLAEDKAKLQTAWGGKYAYNVQVANTAAAAFADEKELAELKSLGVLENPAFLRLMHTVGEAVSPDRLHLRPDGGADVVGMQRQIEDLMNSDAYKNQTGAPHDAVLEQILQLRERLTAAKG